MRKQFTGPVFTILALTAVLVSIFGASFAFANGQSHTISHAQYATSAKPATAPMVSMHTVDMRGVPGESASSAKLPARTMPWLTGVSPAVYAQRKAAALHNKNAPIDAHPYQDTPYTPTTLAKFKGMADSASICPPYGCEPPDQALATSSSWVLEGVNASFAVYNTTGTRQSGWPKQAKSFFGVPNPGSCSPSGPFLSDPRAFYDPKDGRFWAAMLEVEGAFGVNTCPEKTFYWIAVSQTNNPNGTWNVYHFNMAINVTGSCPTCAADYTQFGFDQTAIYFSGNMFSRDGNTYMYAEMYSALKSTMEAGSSVTAYGSFKLTANGVKVDTVQPVENEASSGPGAGLLINSFNINGDGTHNCFSTACSGVVVWAIAHAGTSSYSLSSVIVSTNSTYIAPPSADEPGCLGCIETLDTRISGTPVYQAGSISFALESALNNGTQNVPGIFYGLVQPTISGGKITGASVNLNGTFAFSGDRAASFPALMQTNTGNLLMVFDTMSGTLDPSIMYATRRTTDIGGFEPALYLKKSLVATNNSRWGDYEATSYDGTATNNVWFSAQYSGSNADWATFIGKVNF